MNFDIEYDPLANDSQQFEFKNSDNEFTPLISNEISASNFMLIIKSQVTARNIRFNNWESNKNVIETVLIEENSGNVLQKQSITWGDWSETLPSVPFDATSIKEFGSLNLEKGRYILKIRLLFYFSPILNGYVGYGSGFQLYVNNSLYIEQRFEPTSESPRGIKDIEFIFINN